MPGLRSQIRLLVMQFQLDNDIAKQAFKEYVNNIYLQYVQNGKRFYLDIKEGSEIRSLEQNKYYWSVVVPIAKEVIKETDGRILCNNLTHEDLKYKLGTQVFSEEKYYTFIYNSDVISLEHFSSLPYLERNKCTYLFRMPSTAEMTKKQFSEYVKLIQEWASFLGFEIPDPI